MAVEIPGLSKFKLQLLALISDARDLRDRERSAREELHQSKEKKKQIEAEYSKRLQELSTELASRDELRKKLESRIKYLENENELLEKKEIDLKQTITGLLRSREVFVRHYEDSTYTLKHAVQTKDKELAVVSEKLHRHLLLFSSIEKEASSVKQVLDGLSLVVNEKEQVVTELKDKVHRISTLEKDFVEKINLLESKLSGYQFELQQRDATILDLKERLEAEKISSNIQPKIEELQKTLSVKDEMIQRLTSEKQLLHLELHNMEVGLQKVQDTFIKMSAEEQKGLSLVIGSQVLPELVSKEQDDSSENMIQERQDDPSDDRGDTGQAGTARYGENQSGNGICVEDVFSPPLPKASTTSSPKPQSSPAATIGSLQIFNDANMVSD